MSQYCDGEIGSRKLLVHCLEPADVVMGVANHVNIDLVINRSSLSVVPSGGMFEGNARAEPLGQGLTCHVT